MYGSNTWHHNQLIAVHCWTKVGFFHCASLSSVFGSPHPVDASHLASHSSNSGRAPNTKFAQTRSPLKKSVVASQANITSQLPLQFDNLLSGVENFGPLSVTSFRIVSLTDSPLHSSLSKFQLVDLSFNVFQLHKS